MVLLELEAHVALLRSSDSGALSNRALGHGGSAAVTSIR
jgi:hypothetical protein